MASVSPTRTGVTDTRTATIRATSAIASAPASSRGHTSAVATPPRACPSANVAMASSTVGTIPTKKTAYVRLTNIDASWPAPASPEHSSATDLLTVPAVIAVTNRLTATPSAPGITFASAPMDAVYPRRFGVTVTIPVVMDQMKRTAETRKRVH